MATLLKTWMRLATPAEQEELAQRAGTKRSYLYHLSAEKTKAYSREPEPALAAAIERVTAEMHRTTKGRLPRIYRTDLVEACRQCEFAQRCLKGNAVRGDFPLVDPQLQSDSEGGNHD